MNDDTERRLNALVGEAIRALVDSGADAEFVGAFARAHPQRVANILGVTAEASSGAPDLLGLVTQAVQAAMASNGTPKNTSRRARFYVMVGAKRTSITLGRSVAEALSKVKPPQRARELVQELAESCPAGEERSAWVESRLFGAIELINAESGGAASH